MTPFNRRKRLVYGRYITSLHKITLDSLAATAFVLAAFVGVSGIVQASMPQELVSPLVEGTTVVSERVVYVPVEQDMTSAYVDAALDEFVPKKNHSEARMILHCLLHRESGHGASNAHGDGGLAGGPMQFHESTWVRMRSAMRKQGLEVDDSTRYDLKESIRTTVWAIQNGRAREWGPILRGSKGSNFAACQEPSWIR